MECTVFTGFCIFCFGCCDWREPESRISTISSHHRSLLSQVEGSLGETEVIFGGKAWERVWVNDPELVEGWG